MLSRVAVAAGTVRFWTSQGGKGPESALALRLSSAPPAPLVVLSWNTASAVMAGGTKPGTGTAATVNLSHEMPQTAVDNSRSNFGASGKQQTVPQVLLVKRLTTCNTGSS